MKIIIFFIALFGLAYLGSLYFGRKDQKRKGSASVSLLGAEFLFLGLFLGPNALDILNYEVLQQLKPILALGIGWVGYLFASQLNLQDLRKFSRGFFMMSIAPAATAFVLILGLLLAALSFGQARIHSLDLYAIAILAAAGAITSPTVLAFNSSRLRSSQAAFRMIYFISSLDGLWMMIPVTGATILFIFFTIDNQPILVRLLWAFSSIFMGIAMGYFLRFLLRLKFSQKEFLLIAIGFVILGSGIAHFIGVSPLLLNFFSGLVLANTNEYKSQMHEMLAKYEKIFYLLFLLLAGAMWQIPGEVTLPFLGLYMIARVMGKILGAYTAAHIWSDPTVEKQKYIGVTLLPQGGLSLALALDFLERFPGSWAHIILSIVSLSMLLSLLISPPILQLFLGSAEKKGKPR